ncbi:hypothetical protein [Arenibacter certesii]|uniref:D-glucuronyl C5-epimerase C-terminal domain-containing protein n=1 Tax=Arenibacter certesii TaxID=228955 RepID=A0A918IU33_9FLAO|nr:hypothetical protein [Arenibacter certesii]GGW28570.1 hypothetical protein GCM10007383_12440 [Arenibacter certesii]
MNGFSYWVILNLVLLLGSCKAIKNEITERDKPVMQISLARIDAMPNLPKPYKIMDFKTLAKDFDSLAFDPSQTGEYWPLVWEDDSKKNFDQKTFGMYTAMGDIRQGESHHEGIFHESLSTMGTVLGASLVGIDKSQQEGENYVGMLKNYFNTETNWNIMMNNTSPEVAMLGGGYARDWWYDVYPNVLFYAIADHYPNEPDYESLQRTIADKFYAADSILAGNYAYSFFDYSTMEPKESWICTQEDVAAGHAYVLYSAYKKFVDPKYLRGTKSAIEALLNQKENRFYEILMPFGAYVSARLNAEQGTDYDTKKIMEWTFDGTSVCREGWGVLIGNWNGYDVSGLVGSTVDHGGFAFLMNTYDTMWPLVPMVRYDPRYANAVGKWMLNASNAIKFFYPYEMPDDHQTIPERKDHTKGVIAYEGLIKEAHFEEYQHIPAPVAIGDGPHWIEGNPDVSQFSVYGSGHVGIAAAIIEKTDVPEILKLNCLATDFYSDMAYPTFLIYNPHPEQKVISYICETLGKVDLYDAISHQIVAKNVTRTSKIEIPSMASRLIVEIPANSTIIRKDGKYYANHIVIAYK